MTTQSYRLLMHTGPNPGRIFDLLEDEIRIGRGSDNDIVISEMEISREHARLSAQADSYVIEDLGSTNGTYIDGQRLIGPHLLRSGETIGLGENVSLVFEPVHDPDATIVPPPRIAGTPETAPVEEAVEPAQMQEAAPIPTTPQYVPTGQPAEPAPRPEPVIQPVQAVPVSHAVTQQPVPPEPDQDEEELVEEQPLFSWRWVGAGFGCLMIVACILLIAALFWIDSGGEARWCEYLGFLFPACP